MSEDLPKPMVEIDSVEIIAFNAGLKGGEEYLKKMWGKILFWTGSISGYVFGIITLIKIMIE